MLYRTRFVAVLCFALLAQVNVSGADPEVVARGKQATALVVVPSRGVFGTAFYVDQAGYFVTNQHVVRGVKDSLTLIIESGEANEREVEARVVRVDKQADLALLFCKDQAGLMPLELGQEDGLFETAEVTAFGYPLGTTLAVKKQRYPNITVSVGRVSAIRRVDDQIEEIQLDAVLNPGNSGGPVVDQSGKVVGIVVAKIGNTDLNVAIPVSRLHAFLARPAIAFVPPTISLLQRHEPVELAVDVASFYEDDRHFKVAIEWSSSAKDHRRLELTTEDGRTFCGTIVPIPVDSDAADVEIIAEFADGAVQGRAKDREIRLGEESFPLREIRRIIRERNRYTVTLNSDKTVNGNGLANFPEMLQVGGQSVKFDLLRADRISVSMPAKDIKPIEYAIVVTEAGYEVLREEGQITLRDDPDRPQIIAETLRPLGGQSRWPAYLESSADIVYEPNGLRVGKGRERRYVRSKSSKMLSTDFTFEVEFLMPAKHESQHPTTFIGLGTVERGAYEEPQNCAYLRIHPPYLSGGEVGLSNRPVTSGTNVGKLRTVGPHLARIQKKENLVTFHIDVDHDGPSPDDITRTIPDIRAFVPVLNEKNTHVFFGGAALFTQVSFTENLED